MLRPSKNSGGNKAAGLALRYEAALRLFLRERTADGSEATARLGRCAEALGLQTLDMALIHEQALLKLVRPVDVTPEALVYVIKRAGTFFSAAIRPLEEAHRIAVSSSRQLHRMNQSLCRRTRELATSNRKLKREIERRKVMETNLRQSEQQSRVTMEASRLLQGQLRRLSHRILEVQEEERRRISRELHDVVAQLLACINVRLTALKMESVANTKGIGRRISNAQRLVEKSVDIVHRFARELRPAMLDDLGLIPALRAFMGSFAKETGVSVSLKAFAGVEKLSNVKRTVLYRVAQEALSNVARHAQASRVDVCLQRLSDAVLMRVKDDGKAFDVERVWKARKGRRLGLLGMRERVEMVGGVFKIESQPSLGTDVQALIPLRNGYKECGSP